MRSFNGSGRRLSKADIEKVATFLKCSVEVIRAVIEVETSGSGFGPENRPIILFEPHVFFRMLPEDLREEAVRRGLAYKKQGEKPYPKLQLSRYELQLFPAMKIDEEAALKSCSWGLGQVMGYNHRMAGFGTVDAFVDACLVSEGEQLMAMARFIAVAKLDDNLRARDWEAFARGYNGPGYKKNDYAVKLREAYERNLVVQQKEKEPMGQSQSPPWPSTMDAEAAEFGDRLTAKYGGRVDYLGWVRWSSDFRMLRGNNNDKDAAWAMIERNIDLIRSGQPEQPYPPGQYDVPWPPSMDREAEWFGPKLETLYSDNNHPLDSLGWVRWSSDYRVHRANGIDQDRAWLRVENEIRQIWGLPVVLPPPGPFTKRTGNVGLSGRMFYDDGGPFLAVGATAMHAAATAANYPGILDEDSRLCAGAGFTYTRKIAMLDGGSIDPDPWIWGNDEGAGNTSMDRIVNAIKRDYDNNGLRTFLTFWGGLKNWNTQQKRKDALNELLPQLKPIKHMLLGGEITNENWMNWTGFATYADMRELATMVQAALGPGFPLAMSAPSGVADDMSHPNEQFAEIRDMYYNNPAATLATYHFSRTVNKVDGIWRPYRQPWENVISVPAPDANQNIAGYLGLPAGTVLTPNASLNNEPIGVNSSGAADDNADRQVIAAVISFVAGQAGYDMHNDQGVWRDRIYPGYQRPDRGSTQRLSQVSNISLMLEGFKGMLLTLPGDLPSWTRTRHGLLGHPFGPSFEQRSNGFTQIWPDGVTPYGVVRAYAAYKGNDFVCPLLGVKDHFDLKPAHNMKVVLFRPAGWETIESLTLTVGQTYKVTHPEVVAVGRYL